MADQKVDQVASVVQPSIKLEHVSPQVPLRRRAIARTGSGANPINLGVSVSPTLEPAVSESVPRLPRAAVRGQSSRSPTRSHCVAASPSSAMSSASTSASASGTPVSATSAPDGLQSFGAQNANNQ